MSCGKEFNVVTYKDGDADYEICNKLNLCPECKNKESEGK